MVMIIIIITDILSPYIVTGTYSVKCCDVETLGDPLRGPWVTYMDSPKKYKNNELDFVLDFQKNTNM